MTRLMPRTLSPPQPAVESAVARSYWPSKGADILTSFDPISRAFVAATLLTTAGAACFFPARRAAAVDPATALRHDW